MGEQVQCCPDQRGVGHLVVEPNDAAPGRNPRSRPTTPERRGSRARADPRWRSRRSRTREPGDVTMKGTESGSVVTSADTPRPRTARSAPGSVPIVWTYARTLQVLVGFRSRRRRASAGDCREADCCRPDRRPELGAIDPRRSPCPTHLDHVQHALFGAARETPYAQIAIVGRRRKVVDRVVLAELALRRLRIDQQPLLAGEAHAHVELGDVLGCEAPQVVVVTLVELHAADAGRRRVAELTIRLTTPPARNALERRSRVIGLRLHPSAASGFLRSSMSRYGSGTETPK